MNTTSECKFQYPLLCFSLVAPRHYPSSHPWSNFFFNFIFGRNCQNNSTATDSYSETALGHELHKNYVQKVSLGGLGVRGSRGEQDGFKFPPSESVKSLILFITAGRV